MTVKEYIEKNGIDVCCDELKTWSYVDVGFINSDGEEDETEFDVKDINSSNGITCLSYLFTEFCKENNFSNKTVIYVSVCKSASTYNELAKLG